MDVDNAVVIGKPGEARIRGLHATDDTVVQMRHDEFFIRQDEDRLLLSRAQAEALFLVLDTMLHPDEVEAEGSFAAGVDPDFDDYDFFDIPVFDPR
jgi:hypothetical protein